MRKDDVERAVAEAMDTDNIRVALVHPDGSIITGPLVGVRQVEEDGEPILIFVASAQRMLIL